MPINRLEIVNFRNLASVELMPAPALNLIYGDNAAGKTSVLEAIAVLSSLRSFRSPNLNEVVRHQTSGFRLTARITDDDGREVVMGLQREQGQISIRADGAKLSKTSELSERLPVQAIHPDSHLLVSGGPKQRRRFLDWGVFHVEPLFLPAWRRYDKALRQRNAALRAGQGWNAVSAWDGMMAEAATVIHRCRQAYIEALRQVLPEFAGDIAGTDKVEIDYRPGWDHEQSLQQVLAAGRQRDQSRGFTCSGPHRAELVFRTDGRQADNYVSRGQQKMLVFALLLSQVKLYAEQRHQACVVLLDDLAAELDRGHQQRILQHLQALSAQVFITAIDAATLGGAFDLKRFHVEHGRIEEVI